MRAHGKYNCNQSLLEVNTPHINILNLYQVSVAMTTSSHGLRPSPPHDSPICWSVVVFAPRLALLAVGRKFPRFFATLPFGNLECWRFDHWRIRISWKVFRSTETSRDGIQRRYPGWFLRGYLQHIFKINYRYCEVMLFVLNYFTCYFR